MATAASTGSRSVLPPCYFCGQPLAPWRHPDLARCPGCGLGQNINPPSPEEMDELYSDSYYDSWGESEAYWELKRALFRSLMTIAGEGRTPGRVLDVGCATGACLSVVVEAGCQAVGLDLNPKAISESRRRVPQAEVLSCTLEAAPLAPDSFDLIILSDVLEHVSDPQGMLNRVRELLAPGGVTVVLTPDMGSLSARLMGPRWLHIKPEHLFYFSRPSLEGLLRRAGLRVRRLSGARKPLNLHYAATQLRAYPVAVLTPLMTALHGLLPSSLGYHLFHVPMGEMLACAVKPD